MKRRLSSHTVDWIVIAAVVVVSVAFWVTVVLSAAR